MFCTHSPDVENVMLEDSFERIFWDFYYTDSPTGFQMIQGSNIAFISSLVRVNLIISLQRRALWITVRLKA